MIPDELKRATPLKGKERLGQTRDSDYLGAEDLDENTEPTLTIDHIYNAIVTLQRGKEVKDVLTFKEQSVPGIKVVRPLIVNATNRKMLRKLYKSVTAETLEGKRITLYLEHNVRDPSTGDKVDGIRIRPRVPAAAKAETYKCELCGAEIVAWGKYSAEEMALMSKNAWGGHVYCLSCSNKLKAEQAAKAEQENAPTNEAPEQEVQDNAE